MCTRPSDSSCSKASRTGTRLTLSSWAILSCTRCEPPRKRPDKMASRRNSKTSSWVVRRSRTTAAPSSAPMRRSSGLVVATVMDAVLGRATANISALHIRWNARWGTESGTASELAEERQDAFRVQVQKARLVVARGMEHQMREAEIGIELDLLHVLLGIR